VSSALRIASVTHVLKDLLNDGLINQNVSAVVGTAINVTSLPPGQVEPQQGNAASQLNLFMHRVSYNTGWNNFGYPSRDARGGPVSNPPLALNLHYLLTAFGEVELHAEILLGYAMQLLHENPVLDRNLIRNSLSVASATNPGGRLPSDLLALTRSGLAEQFEQIKIAPEPLNTEEMSKLWTAFQTKYRPCTAYVATVVLIESDKPSSSPLPVMRRNVYAVPFRQPVINKILSSENIANAKVTEFRRIVTGDILVLEGEQLKSEGVTVKIGEVEIVPDEANISGTRISVELDAGLGLKAGIHGVQVVQPIVVEESGTSNLREFKGAYSNLEAFVLSPSITNNPTATTNATTDIEVEVVPNLQKGQKVMLILNETNLAVGVEPVSYSFILPPDVLSTIAVPVNSVTFEIETEIKAGDYLVRIQVDGAGSPLTTNTNGEFTGPTLTIP
jgi:Pvc16 N-terminal domain